MPFFQIRGQTYEAASPEEARQIAARNEAVAGMGGMERFGRGALAGATGLGRNVANMVLPQSLEPEWATREAIQREAQGNRALLDTGAGKAGAFVGETLATLPVGGVAGMGAKAALTQGGKLLAKQAAARAGAPVASAMAGGALEGAAAAGPDNRLTGAAVGGTVGALMPWAANRLANPVAATPEARLLMDKGVDLTPGQMNPRSGLGALEELGSKVPFIEKHRARAQEQAVRRGLQMGAAPQSTFSRVPGQVLDQMPAEDVAARMMGSYRPGYGSLQGISVQPRKMNVVGPDVPLASFPQTRGLLEQAARDPGISATAKDRKAANQFMQNALTALPSAGKGAKPVDFEAIQRLRSTLRSEARRLGQSEATKDRADLIRRGADNVTQVLESQLRGGDFQRLTDLDRRYADAAVLRNAMERSGGREGGFTFSQGMQALRPTEGAQFGTGGTGSALSQYMRAGKKVFDEKTPATGARLILPALAALGLGKAALIPVAGITLAATTKGGRKFIGGNMAAQRKLAARLAALRDKGATGAGYGAIGAGGAAAIPNEQEY
jgi:hypothetical protein